MPTPYGTDRRICTVCCVPKLLSEFHPDSPQCRHCANQQARERYREKKVAETNKAITTIANAVKQKHIDAPPQSEVAELFVKFFGSAEKFVQKWGEQLEIACDKYPGKKTTLDGLARVNEIWKGAYESQDTLPEAAELTAEQIELEFRACCLRILREDKELLFSIVNEAGYEVVPMDSDKLIKMVVEKSNGT